MFFVFYSSVGNSLVGSMYLNVLYEYSILFFVGENLLLILLVRDEEPKLLFLFSVQLNLSLNSKGMCVFLQDVLLFCSVSSLISIFD